MKIETRKRKSTTQKVKSNFSLVQRASVLFLLFKSSLRYPLVIRSALLLALE